ncbi:LacI family DNA-binding transcriptional regulator [Cellulomonas bogoriensis]|uniref:LacI family transcriptional regulator n=1 Tax=Cellulomonas bogoriensis 69B4 = DSM 16987 TaxID=1386082 RepID=A0A0A0BUD3_9CELL|nr:substrate-binding domain-containing protein [Cellulomonas bogoriensis]KGM11546.1 LacI family transcriptional regulator [Cellulomonas bogoriensis 69B4 = DSM 16987]
MAHTRPTLAHVAGKAGVSVSTASLAFSGAGPIAAETRAKVLAAARELGYSGPNPLGRSLRSGRSGIVAVVIGDQLRRSFRDPVSVRVLDGLVSTLGQLGLGVLLVPGLPVEEDRAVDPLVESAPMDVAVLIWGSRTQDPIREALQRRGVPMVIGEGPSLPDVPLVGIHDRRGTAELGAYLRSLGHERVAVVALPFGGPRRCAVVDADRMGELDWAPTRNRLQGLADAGVAPTAVVEAGASLVEEGQAAGRLLLDVDDPPTAVVAQSDLLAAGVLLAARDLGLRVPQDVSVAGFDGLDLPWIAPDVLTTVDQPLAAKGQALGEAVAAVLAGEEPQTVTLDVTLRVGTTTGPPR